MLILKKYGRILGVMFIGNCLLFAYYFYISGKHIERSIFLLETSGAATLNVRQACAVESAARHNPSMNVYVLMTSSSPIDDSENPIKKIQAYQNVHFQRISIDEFVRDSPITGWFRQGEWKKSQWKVSHMSDGLRYFLMWKYGGIYLDMDTVTLRSLGHFKNAAFREDSSSISSAVLIFERGHELFRRCMVDLEKNYDPSVFAYSGPGVLTSNIEKYCAMNSTHQAPSSDCGIDIFTEEAANPIHWSRWENYFAESSVENVTAVLNSSYVIHVWNKLSYKHILKVGSGSFYELVIKQHCPIVYKYAQQVGHI